uniref:Uncharacterized protein n=1 Tax=Pseudomonas phage BL5 TaxID=3109218 RepID=A0AAU7B915_9VIRU
MLHCDHCGMSHTNDRTPGHGVLDSSLANLIRTF